MTERSRSPRRTVGGTRRRLSAVVALAVVGGCVMTAAASGAQPPAFAIAPQGHSPYFILRLAPGTTVRRAVRVTNVGDRVGQVRLAGVDATTGATSGAVYLAPEAARRAVGGWLNLSSSLLTLAPRQSAVVPFTVAVPSATTAGDHLGGLVAAPVQPVASHTTRRGRSAFRVQVNEVSVVGVEVRVPGPAHPAIAIGAVRAAGRPGYQTLLIGLRDSGNTLVKGAGRVVLRSARGNTVVDNRFRLDTFVPGTRIDFPVYLRQRLPAGRYRATIDVSFDGHTVHATHRVNVGAREIRQTYGSKVPAALNQVSVSASSTPLGLIIGGAVALLVAGIGGTALYFRSRLRAAQTGGDRRG